MPLEASQLVELKGIVDDVRAGRRVIIFPPGTYCFALMIVLLSLAFLFGYLSLLVLLFDGFGPDVKAKALLQLLGVVLVFPFTVFPGFLALRGKNTLVWYKLLSASLVIACALGLIGAETLGSGKQMIPLLVATFFSVASVFVTRKTNVDVFFHYFYLLRR